MGGIDPAYGQRQRPTWNFSGAHYLHEMDHAPSDQRPAHYVNDVLDKLDDLTGRDRIQVSDVLNGFGATAFIPILMLPALLVVSPLSGIPGFSSLCGITIGLIASQLFFHRRSLWLPGLLRRRAVSGPRLHDAIGRVRKVADWIDRHSRDRLHPLTSRIGHHVAYLACMLCGFAMPFLEIVPFSSSLLGLAVLCIATGLLAVDGLFVIVGFTIIAGASLIPVALWSGLAGA